MLSTAFVNPVRPLQEQKSLLCICNKHQINQVSIPGLVWEQDSEVSFKQAV